MICIQNFDKAIEFFNIFINIHQKTSIFNKFKKELFIISIEKLLKINKNKIYFNGIKKEVTLFFEYLKLIIINIYKYKNKLKIFNNNLDKIN